MTDTFELNKKTEPVMASFILKGGSTTSGADRDAGFCSGGDEDDLEIEDDIHSPPTDVSEDSVEVKVTPISSRNKNKRKCAEPRKVEEVTASAGPLKKRIRFDIKTEPTSLNHQHQSAFFEVVKKEPQPPIAHLYDKEDLIDSKQQEQPFRPWSISSNNVSSPPPNNYHPVYGYHPPDPALQEQPLSLVKTKTECRQLKHRKSCTVPDAIPGPSVPLKIEPPRVPPHPGVVPVLEFEEQSKSPKTTPDFTVESLLSSQASTSSSAKEKTEQSLSLKDQQKEQRNYKNMTRERRIEANARERTRVHTISAAFDTLRRAVPAYSHNQKLSKLSVLRIACSYILTLSRVAGSDYSADQSEPSLADCVDLVSRTIQTEGKLRKKKDE